MAHSQSAQAPEPTSIDRNIHLIKERIARAAEKSGRSSSEVTLVAVTKTVSAERVHEAFAAGIEDFGESRVQEAAPKIEQLQSLDLRPVWHMVGHLQTNKAKPAAELFDFIQSIDSVRVAQAVSAHASHDIRVLLQVNLAGEETKSGFAAGDVAPVLAEISRLPHVDVKGLMTIAPYTRDPEDVRPVFRQLRMLRDSLGLEHLSMGMTDDYQVAVEEGATMVRIGRAIFGDWEMQT